MEVRTDSNAEMSELHGCVCIILSLKYHEVKSLHEVSTFHKAYIA